MPDPVLLTPELLLRWIQATAAALAFFVGASAGSFLNVVAYRLPLEQSVVHPRSRCPACATPIAWYDNLPVLSYLILRGKCRACRASISAQYPLVELACGVLGLALWWLRGPSALLLIQAIVVGLLVALALIDARHYQLPEVLTLPLLAVALLGRVVSAWVDGRAGVLDALAAGLDGLLGATLGAGVLGAIGWLGTRLARRSGRIRADEDAMGWGDVVLIAGIGAHVGPRPLLAVLFLASVQGAVIGALMLWRGRGGEASRDAAVATAALDKVATRSPAPTRPDSTDDDADEGADEDDWQPPAQAIPFGPFLALGTIQWILLERSLTALYERLITFLVP